MNKARVIVTDWPYKSLLRGDYVGAPIPAEVDEEGAYEMTVEDLLEAGFVPYRDNAPTLSTYVLNQKFVIVVDDA